MDDTEKEIVSEEFMTKFKLLLKEAVAKGLDTDEVGMLAEAVLEADTW